ncbi:hypothetical protein XFF6990_260005 [Xanthomonas citri pv. fuscans]|uniref:Uncharacterized protein n=1 Tax=Xanthomonas campestris pv. phaseoli TaxID=317013 RepID=A0A7Z7NJ71_XANCH|nr:hypothetical protein XFF6990_260005 [Xanthomonas citri pv. fuscans]SOO26854.1 hypothetical protein XFF6991_70006 [Xanthomonas phaseoli pv. phaseoli]
MRHGNILAEQLSKVNLEFARTARRIHRGTTHARWCSVAWYLYWHQAWSFKQVLVTSLPQSVTLSPNTWTRERQ